MYEKERELGVRTALYSATAEGRVEVVQRWLENAPDKIITNTLGTNTRRLAKREGRLDCIDVLKAHGSQHGCETTQAQ